MRHRRKGRVLGRSPSHQRALLRNLASALMLTERETEAGEVGAAKVTGRIVTTVAKAKEVRPLVERCITIAKHGLQSAELAREFASTADRNSSAWKQWRESDQWRKWAQASAPVVVARRRLVRLLGDKKAARILFEKIAPRFVDRPGGYTRILKLATPRLGDAGPRALLEFVGSGPRPDKGTAPQVQARRPGRSAGAT
ncbi:MAG: 50S ribosomal protein L17 [Planctomycetota bacterium]|nr:MAG: 50S ribosomal protein L17 [Planctomycetota bacterium]